MLFLSGLSLSAPRCQAGSADLTVDFSAYDESCGIDIVQVESRVQITWPISRDEAARMSLDLKQRRGLIRSLSVQRSDQPFNVLASHLDPVLYVRVGQRHLDDRRGWTIFFDRMQRKPSELYLADIRPRRVAVASNHRRATISIGKVTAGPFNGTLRWTFFAGEPFVLQEARLTTSQDDVAYLYDAGIVFHEDRPISMMWHDARGPLEERAAAAVHEAIEVPVRGRTIAAKMNQGAMAIFPPPHRYFYPLDFSDNLKNIWLGPGYQNEEVPFGFGIRHNPRGDNRFVPWFNAPPGSEQAMGMFLYLSTGSAKQNLDCVARLTRNDRFAPLPGYKVFTSHYHVEHTVQLIDAQQDTVDSPKDVMGTLPSGGSYRIPDRLQEPGFVRTFRDLGVDIVHLAEFHFGRTPGMNTRQRLRHLEMLHAECRRLSDETFLLLPGEEPNVHLGGHWISFFPRPVYWVLNRPDGKPFVTDNPQLGPVYHVGSKADVLRLLKVEGGLAWTAHPRIKSSTGYPDAYRNELFYQSDRFLGAAWKAMPADLSQPRLGRRVLHLMDDMSNWGHPKCVVGEVDVFKIEPDHELYGHMNVNYVKLDELPHFERGWQSLLESLRRGKFFVTTGEVLIPHFEIDGKSSGQLLQVDASGSEVQFEVTWTFPLAFAEIIAGDGQRVTRHSIDLSATGSFGSQSFTVKTDLNGKRWVRLEVWDIATNGAFTQPIRLEQGQ